MQTAVTSTTVYNMRAALAIALLVIGGPPNGAAGLLSDVYTAGGMLPLHLRSFVAGRAAIAWHTPTKEAT
jgi:hypothetical protein